MSSYSAIGAGGPAWRVISVTEATGQDATGRYVNGRNVTYQLASGPTGTVFIPAGYFNEESVRAAINDDAATLHNVANLSSGG